MKIEQKEYFNELTPETDYSLYAKEEMPLYKDSYFCKIMYCPKTMTLKIAETLYAEIADSEISSLPERKNENENEKGDDDI